MSTIATNIGTSDPTGFDRAETPRLGPLIANGIDHTVVDITTAPGALEIVRSLD